MEQENLKDRVVEKELKTQVEMIGRKVEAAQERNLEVINKGSECGK